MIPNQTLRFILISLALIAVTLAGCAQVPSNADLASVVNSPGAKSHAARRSSTSAHLARKTQRPQKTTAFKKIGQQLANVTKRSAKSQKSGVANTGQTINRKQWLAKAEALESQGDITQAIAAYEQVIAAYPNDGLALHRLAVCHDRGGNAAASSKLYLRAMHFKPSDPELLCDYGYSRYAHGDALQAESMLRRALQIDKNHARSHANLGLVLAKLGRKDEAIASFLKCGVSRADAEANVRNVMQQENAATEAVAMTTESAAKTATPKVKQVAAATAPVKATLVSAPTPAAKPKLLTIPASAKLEKVVTKSATATDNPFEQSVEVVAETKTKKTSAKATEVAAVTTSLDSEAPPAPPVVASTIQEEETVAVMESEPEPELERPSEDDALLQSLVDHAVDESLQYINNSLRKTIRR